MTNEEKRMIVRATEKVAELEKRIEALEASLPKRRKPRGEARAI